MGGGWSEGERERAVPLIGWSHQEVGDASTACAHMSAVGCRSADGVLPHQTASLQAQKVLLLLDPGNVQNLIPSPPPHHSTAQGDTAVYLLYAHARIAAILRKSGKDIAELAKRSNITLGNDLEVALALHVSRFPGAPHAAAGGGWARAWTCGRVQRELVCVRGGRILQRCQ